MPENTGNNLDDELVKQQAAKKHKALLATGATVAAGAVVLAAVFLIGEWAAPVPQVPTEAAELAPQPVSTLSREELQQPLNAAKERSQKLQNTPGKATWQPQRSDVLVQRVEQLFLDYAAGNYAQVEQDLTDINDAFDRYDSEYQQAYQSAQAKAQQAFEAEKIETATLHNSEALRINPGFAPAQQLAKRIHVFADVKSLQAQIQAAEAESDLDKQASLLKQVLALDSNRQVEAQKLASVSQQIQQRDFAQAFANATLWLEAGTLPSAQDFLNQARRIDSSRPELQQLQSKINQAQGALQRDQLVAQIEQLKLQDRWPDVRRILQSQLPKYPNEPGLQRDFELAQDIDEAKGLLQVYLDRPKRLLDGNIQRVASEDLLLAAKVQRHSPSLAAMADDVKTKLLAAQAPVAVQFNSDGRTEIKVLKVGNVGKTKGRTVDLPPGTYNVEGRRKGYKTVLLSLVVEPGKSNEITIICNEKL